MAQKFAIKFFLPLMFLVGPLNHWHFFDFAAQWALKAQTICENVIQQNAISEITMQENSILGLKQAVLCGSDRLSETHRSEFKTLGIYHVIVVSGSHLVFLATVLEFGNLMNRPFRFLLLVVYSILTGLQAPVTRALLSQVLSELNKFFKLSRPYYWRTFDSYVISILFFPAWRQSLSLLLSTLASLSTGLGKTIHPQLNSIFKDLFVHSGVFMILYFFLLPYGCNHPFTILTNLFLANLAGFGLLLLSLLSILISPLSTIIDQLILLSLQALRVIAKELTDFTNNQPILVGSANAPIQGSIVLAASVLWLHLFHRLRTKL
jgi:predicted membrane metal-binding protein